MISTSSKWKQWSAEYGLFHIKATIDNGTSMTLTDEDFMLGSVSITDSVSGMGAFNVGGVITNGFNATLNNFTGKFNHYNLAGATIDVKFGIVYGEDYVNNLFDKTAATPNKIMSNTGTVTTQMGWFVSDYIPVTDGETYKTNFHTMSVPSYVCCFDSSKNFLGSVNRDGQYITASVEGETVAYVVGCGQMGSINDVYFYEYASVEEWIDRGVYTLEKPTSLGSTIKITGYDFMDRLNKRYNGGFDILTNILDTSTITQSKMILPDGTIADENGYYITDYISASANASYRCNLANGFIACYDSAKDYIGNATINGYGVFTTLAPTVYIRGTGISALLPQAYIESTPNLFNPSTVTSDSRINQDGTISSGTGFVTGYVPVDNDTSYETNLALGYVVCYDSSLNYLGYVDLVGGNQDRRIFTAHIEGETVAYVRGNGSTGILQHTYVQFYNGTFIFPMSAESMVDYLCQTYNVGFDANSWQLDSFNVDEFEYNENTSCRQVLSWIMEIGGGYARVNPQGVIECRKFNRHEWTSDATLNGGTINPWESVSAISGGTFSPWSSVTDYDGGSTGGAEFTLSKIKSLDVYIEDITITGIKAIYNNDGQVEELYGNEGYVLGIDNPMISASNATAVATRVGTALNGLTFRPFNASIFGDPSFEAGDVVALKDYLGEEHISLITSLTYSLNQAERLECNAETTMQNSYRY